MHTHNVNAYNSTGRFSFAHADFCYVLCTVEFLSARKTAIWTMLLAIAFVMNAYLCCWWHSQSRWLPWVQGLNCLRIKCKILGQASVLLLIDINSLRWLNNCM